MTGRRLASCSAVTAVLLLLIISGSVTSSDDGASSAVAGAAVGVPLSWEPFYCVLQQDRRILTAYTSEELARNIIRVLNLWQKNNVFSPQVIQPLLDMADPNHPLHQEIQQQQNNTANGEQASGNVLLVEENLEISDILAVD